MTDDCDTGEQDPKKILDILRFKPDEVVTERIQFPSALWARLVMNKPDDVPVGEYTERLVNIAIGTLQFEEEEKMQVDVELGPEQWERLRLQILYAMQTQGKSLEIVFWDHMNDHVQLTPNIVVDGETAAPEDVAPDGDDGGDDDDE